MAKSAAEVLIGTGTLYVAVDGTAQPLDPTVAPAGAYVDIGYSEEGWSFNIDRNLEDIEVAEEIDPIDVMQTSREVHMVGVAVQASLENLKTALGAGTITTVAGPPSYKQLVAGGTGDLLRVTLLFRGKAPPLAGVAKTREVWVPHVVSAAAIEMASKKAPDKSQIAMDFRALKITPDELFVVRDLT